MKPTRVQESSTSGWIQKLPMRAAIVSLSVLLAYGQWNPCDSTSVAQGESMLFILGSLGFGFLLALHFGLGGNTALAKHGAMDKSIWTEPGSRWILVSIFLLIGWLSLVTLSVDGRGNARFAFNGYWQWVAQTMLLVGAVSLQAVPGFRRGLMALMISLAFGTALYGVVHYWILLPALRAVADPTSVGALIGAEPGSTVELLLKSRLASTEPTGPFSLTNSLAGFLGPWIVVLWSCLISGWVGSNRSSQEARKIALGNGLVWVALVTMGYVLLLTKSRTAWVATAIGCLGVVLAHPEIRRRILAQIRMRWMISLSIVGGMIALGVVGYRRDPLLFWESGKSLAYRMEYWRGGWQLLGEHPWLGLGPCNFQQAYNRVKPIVASESPADPHNFLVELAVTGGWPLLGGGVLVGLAFVGCIRSKRRNTGAASANRETLDRRAVEQTKETDFLQWGRLMSGSLLLMGLGLVGIAFLSGDSKMTLAAFVFVGGGATAWVVLERCRWIDDGALMIASSWGLGCSLIHLLASGGWMQPGNMDTVCVLAAVVLGTTAGGGFDSKRSLDLRSDGLVRLGPVVGMLGLIVGFYGTMGLPLNATAVRNSQPQNLEPTTIREALLSDRWDPDIPRQIGESVVTAISSSKQAVSWGTVDGVMDLVQGEFVRRDPNHWGSYFTCGRWELSLAAAFPRNSSERASHLARGARWFRKSADLYPASAEVQLQAALACWLVDDREGAMNYLGLSDAIDQATPHLDRKLSAVVAWFPVELQGDPMTMGVEGRRGMQPGNVRGEPLANALRSMLTPSK